ncbi:M23 family metallopeptidase [Nocardia huaxiensis]|uniref:M23 family metallopeptidase n=1 Tax=Nocardia huaxiensis TaxID=2755382 RepID=A0A7D6ZR77_9NOCA|nr:M23 family metallopeptidase [Nocardia huaxiensis]QLY31765.1 M23 family metallopeptidase [Nocardia huaxiensis]UFS95326.1 M23 family metallopeptidase [Nocardia huaxiensis]
MDLLGDCGAGRAGTATRSTRHRAESTTTDRVKVAAGTAVAAGALIGAVTQLVPAIAHASPLAPSHEDQQTADEPVLLKNAAQKFKGGVGDIAATEVTQDAPPVAAAAPVADVAAPAPFGLTNLPPELSTPLVQAENALKQLQQTIAPQQAVRPVAGVISSGYGARWGAMHYGIDFADTLGAPIHSVMSGTVIEAGPASGFGLWVRVQQDDGTTAVYGHVNDMYVSAGQRVNAGDVIASVGNRGNSTGPHLHLEIWDAAGGKMDPLPWLASKGVIMQQQWGPDQ